MEYILTYLEKSASVECVYKFGTEGYIMWCKLYFCRSRLNVGRKAYTYCFLHE